MSAEILRAAQKIRERFEREDVDDVEEAEFYLAVADLLDDVANRGFLSVADTRAKNLVLTVARAYLGEQA